MYILFAAATLAVAASPGSTSPTPRSSASSATPTLLSASLYIHLPQMDLGAGRLARRSGRLQRMPTTPKAMNALYVSAPMLEKALWVTRHLHGWAWIRGWEWPWENGSSASMVMAGIVLSIIYLETKWSLRRKTFMALGYAAATGIVGYVFAPLGISKNRGTPTWCLWTMAACIVCFVLLYWLCDVKKKTAWAAPVRSAGSNTLTTYLLPDYWGMVLGVIGIRFFARPFFHGGWTGVTWAFVFTGLILVLSTLLTKRKVRLAL